MAEGDSHQRSFGDRDSRAEILTPPETVGRDNGATTRGLEMPTGLGKLMRQRSRDNDE